MAVAIQDAVENILYLCTEGRPWIKTYKGFERITYDEAVWLNWPRKKKP